MSETVGVGCLCVRDAGWENDRWEGAMLCGFLTCEMEGAER